MTQQFNTNNNNNQAYEKKSNNFNNNNEPKKERYLRINESIRNVFEVYLIDEEGVKKGIVPFYQALKRAKDLGLDLVEVNRSSVPPLCKIIDYGKYKYDQEKRKKEMRRNQTKIQLKEIVFRPNTDIHDIETKARATRRMLDEGNKVKLTVQMKGREVLHQEIVVETVQQFLKFVGSHTTDSPLRIEGKFAYMIIAK
jgi:translation initiation factor IF-3